MDEFFKAITDGDFDHFHSLLARDPSLANATNEQGVSAMLLTVYYQRHSFTRDLIEAKAAVGLFESAALGDTARLIELTSIDPQAVNRFSPDGFQPLGLAAFFGHTEAALYLIEHGADPNSPSHNDQKVTPLHSAAASNSVRIASALIGGGADVNAKQQGGYTPLHAAVQNGTIEMVQLLIRHGANCMARNDAGRTPREVLNRKNVKEVDMLLAACAENDA